MGIQDFKRWHWIIIGAAVGAILAFARLQTEPGEAVAQSPSMGPARFERYVVNRADSGRSFIQNIHIYPPEEVVREGKVIDKVNVVEFEYVTDDDNDGAGIATKYNTKFSIPFKPTVGISVPEGQELTIAMYLDAMKTRFDHVSYTYAWWVEPKIVYAMFIGGGIVVIGGIWPTIVNLLVGAGLGGERRKEEEYDLDRFGNGEETKPAAGAVTDEDRDQLAAVEASLEASVKSAGIAMTADKPPEDAPIRKLNSTAVEMAQPPAPSEEDKEYKGEFYPVARPQGHTQKKE